MYYRCTTQLPNEIIDTHLSSLNESSIKVLLVVIRQTIGYIYTKTGTRKIKDWISITFFINKTGLARKSITKAISDLVLKQLIIALDSKDNELKTAKDRQGKKRIFYAYKPYYNIQKLKTCVHTSTNMSKIVPNTKLKDTKKNIRNRNKKSDNERIREIIQSLRNH